MWLYDLKAGWHDGTEIDICTMRRPPTTDNEPLRPTQASCTNRWRPAMHENPESTSLPSSQSTEIHPAIKITASASQAHQEKGLRNEELPDHLM